MPKARFLVICSVLVASPAWSFEWSADEYVEKCSVVHQKILDHDDREILAYCMGAMKGVISGLFFPKAKSEIMESGQVSIPACFLPDIHKKSTDTLKNVLATMRLNSRGMSINKEPNTANAAVAFALIRLYPCLLE